jgi:hypothetical protein
MPPEIPKIDEIAALPVGIFARQQPLGLYTRIQWMVPLNLSETYVAVQLVSSRSQRCEGRMVPGIKHQKPVRLKGLRGFPVGIVYGPAAVASMTMVTRATAQAIGRILTTHRRFRLR